MGGGVRKTVRDKLHTVCGLLRSELSPQKQSVREWFGGLITALSILQMFFSE